MNDRDFDDARDAADWINLVEGPGAESRRDRLFRLFTTLQSVASNGDVLDIGCGQGACRLYFDPKRWNYWGVDPSCHLLARARVLHEDAAAFFSPGNAYAIPFESSRFHAAISINVWHLLRNLEMAAREMMRVLKSDGRFLVITAHPQSIHIWAEYYHAHQLHGKHLIGSSLRDDGSKSVDELYFYSEEEIRQELVDSGACGVTVQSFGVTESTVPMYLAIFGQKI